MGTYRSLLDDISGVDGTYKQQLKAIAEGAGGGIMYVTITSEEVDGETVYSADKTLEEIIAAIESGRDVRARSVSGTGVYYLTSWAPDQGDMCAEFRLTTVSPNSPTSASLNSTYISIYNEGDEDVVDVYFVNGNITITEP